MSKARFIQRDMVRRPARAPNVGQERRRFALGGEGMKNSFSCESEDWRPRSVYSDDDGEPILESKGLNWRCWWFS